MLKIMKSFFKRGNIIRFELDDWYEWYKEPQKVHEAVVLHLEKEGKKVETLTTVKKVTSNKISSLQIDGIEYELSIENAPIIGGPAQSVILKRVE